MSLNTEERKAVVEFRLEKAQRAYEQAYAVADMGFWEIVPKRPNNQSPKRPNKEIFLRFL